MFFSVNKKESLAPYSISSMVPKADNKVSLAQIIPCFSKIYVSLFYSREFSTAENNSFDPGGK